YAIIPSDKVALIPTAMMEIPGRVRYRDDFGSYCEPICIRHWGAGWSFGPEDFEPCEPRANVCNPPPLAKSHTFLYFFRAHHIGPEQSIDITPAPAPTAKPYRCPMTGSQMQER